MRSLSVLLLAGCSIIDAAGEAHPPSGSFGSGAGSVGYQSTPVGPGGVSPVRDVAIGELNTIAGLDYAIVDSTGAVRVCLHDGGLGAAFNCQPPSSAGPYDLVEIANLDGDPVDEIVAVSTAPGGRLDILNNTGGDNFSAAPVTAVPPSDLTIGALAIGNVAGSLTPDLAVMNLEANEVRVFVDAAVPPDEPPVVVTTTLDPTAAAMGSFGGEAALVVADGSDLAIFRGMNLTSTMRFGFGDGASAVAFATGFFGHSEDHLDLAILRRHGGSPNDIRLSWGSPSGLFDGGISLGENTSGLDILSGDLDGDSDDDLAVLLDDGAGVELRIFYRGSHEADWEPEDIGAGGPGARRFAMGDLNGDDLPDFILVPSHVSSSAVDLLLSH
jgi:hypothetical protein